MDRKKEIQNRVYHGKSTFIVFYFWCYDCKATIGNNMQEPFDTKYDAQISALELHIKDSPNCPLQYIIISVIPAMVIGDK